MPETVNSSTAKDPVKRSPSTPRIGKRYRANRVDNDYDAIVIGSGVGGLTTAALLCQLGKKVIVLEQHYTAGGFTHAYERIKPPAGLYPTARDMVSCVAGYRNSARLIRKIKNG
jgi:heterodisulfide reductase subunit A-like polyferredoxin